MLQREHLRGSFCGDAQGDTMLGNEAKMRLAESSGLSTCFDRLSASFRDYSENLLEL